MGYITDINEYKCYRMFFPMLSRRLHVGAVLQMILQAIRKKLFLKCFSFPHCAKTSSNDPFINLFYELCALDEYAEKCINGRSCKVFSKPVEFGNLNNVCACQHEELQTDPHPGSCSAMGGRGWENHPHLNFSSNATVCILIVLSNTDRDLVTRYY